MKYKYIPINSDLFDLLVELGYNEKKHTDSYILFPERKVKSKTIMDSLSKAFTHYKNGAGIEKDISLKSLRKTYITWVHQVMQKETGVFNVSFDRKSFGILLYRCSNFVVS